MNTWRSIIIVLTAAFSVAVAVLAPLPIYIIWGVLLLSFGHRLYTVESTALFDYLSGYKTTVVLSAFMSYAIPMVMAFIFLVLTTFWQTEALTSNCIKILIYIVLHLAGRIWWNRLVK